MIQGVRRDIYELLNRGLMNQGQNLSLYFARLCREIDEPGNGEHQAKDIAIKNLENGIPLEAFTVYQRAFDRWRKTWEKNQTALCFEMITRTPLIVGMGDQNVHEFGLTLQHPWGTPFIPGTAVKGIIAAYAQECGDPDWQRNWNSAGPDGNYAEAVFGGVNSNGEKTAGGITFADAWWIPDSRNVFEKDIINVHHPSYYREITSAWPDGTDSPVPVSFVVIRPGVRFLFVFAGNIPWCLTIRDILKQAGQIKGMGGKTRVGYGRMEYVESVPEILARLNTMSSKELSGLFDQKSNDPEYRQIFERAVQERPVDNDLENLFRKFRPAALFLKHLLEKKPATLQEARNIRNNFERSLPARAINRRDPDIQAIFNFCLPLSQGDIQNTWLHAFAFGFDDMVQGKTVDDIGYILIDHLEKLKTQKAVWPTIDRIRQDIANLDDLTEEQKSDLLAIIE